MDEGGFGGDGRGLVGESGFELGVGGGGGAVEIVEVEGDAVL